MAGASLLTLIDDIATILDDVSVMTKVAAKKTAGVLGDDLALNAQQVNGVNADRELPVIWAVAKGSMVNKVILVPVALAISALAPWAVIPLLMLGGLFLCFEGVEKLYHKLFLHEDAKHLDPQQTTKSSEILVVESEQDKIKGAIRTDFVLSAEIIVITLGTAATATFSHQVMVLAGIAIIMTVGVYGLVAGIVKLDDGGLYLAQSKGETLFATLKRKFGFGILTFAPYMMKTLSVVGTAAMFLVGGAILTHGIPAIHHWIEHTANAINNGLLQWLLPTALNGLFGVAAGALALMIFIAAQGLLSSKSKN